LSNLPLFTRGNAEKIPFYPHYQDKYGETTSAKDKRRLKERQSAPQDLPLHALLATTDA
jgi:hypothetical protein